MLRGPRGIASFRIIVSQESVGRSVVGVEVQSALEPVHCLLLAPQAQGH